MRRYLRTYVRTYIHSWISRPTRLPSPPVKLKLWEVSPGADLSLLSEWRWSWYGAGKAWNVSPGIVVWRGDWSSDRFFSGILIFQVTCNGKKLGWFLRLDGSRVEISINSSNPFIRLSRFRHRASMNGSFWRFVPLEPKSKNYRDDRKAVARSLRPRTYFSANR